MISIQLVYEILPHVWRVVDAVVASLLGVELDPVARTSSGIGDDTWAQMKLIGKVQHALNFTRMMPKLPDRSHI